MEIELTGVLSKLSERIVLNGVSGVGNHYSPNDVRASFFKKYNNILRVFYTGFNSIFICNKIDESIDGTRLSKEEIVHVENFGYLLLRDEWHIEYINQLKLSFIINSWSCFESDIDCIFGAILSEEEKLNIRKKKIKKDFKNYIKIDDNSIQIEESKASFYFLAIDYKLKKVLKKLKICDQERKEIEVFCDFYRITRNCIHNNSVYHGKGKVITVLGEEIVFKDGKPISFCTADFLLEIFIELQKKFIMICDHISEDQTIIIDTYVENIGED